MKRIFCLILSLILMLNAAALAESAQPAALPEWLELSADDTVLTVRIPLEDAKDDSCRFLFSAEGTLELLACEVIGDEPEESGESMWVGSFMSGSEEGGPVFLQLGVYDSEGTLLFARMLQLFVREDHSIEVVSCDADSWFYLTEDQCELNIRLDSNPTTGYQWTYEVSDEEILGCAAEEYTADPVEGPVSGSGGVWSARFAATGSKAGHVSLKLKYARPWEDGRAAKELLLSLFVNESGMIQPVVPQPEDEAPLGLYEADDGSSLCILRRSDGTFSAEISIFRLTAQDDGVGLYEDGVLTVTATDASGHPMIWEITGDGEGLKAVVTSSQWELLPEGTEFDFTPVSE